MISRTEYPFPVPKLIVINFLEEKLNHDIASICPLIRSEMCIKSLTGVPSWVS